MHRVPDFKLLAEINNIISEIESELNQLNTVAKKHLANSVYMLGNNYLNVESDNHKKCDNKAHKKEIQNIFLKIFLNFQHI